VSNESNVIASVSEAIPIWGERKDKWKNQRDKWKNHRRSSKTGGKDVPDGDKNYKMDVYILGGSNWCFNRYIICIF